MNGRFWYLYKLSLTQHLMWILNINNFVLFVPVTGADNETHELQGKYFFVKTLKITSFCKLLSTYVEIY